MIFKKINENKIDEKVLENLSKKYNLDKTILEILSQRGINIFDEQELNNFLFADIKSLKDPLLLQNLESVVKRIECGILKNEKILIFGDYDVDGICATSILYLYLKTKTQNVFSYIPNRLEDGYGLSCPCIDKIAEREKPDLIITVDCGISCKKEVEYVKSLGIDIIVTDHHELSQDLPDTLIVNTKFDQEFNFKGLCGAGVSFKIVQALCQRSGESFERFLPICTLATIADIVPLVDENRIIVKEGLKRLDLLPVGVKILLKNSLGTLNGIKSNDIAFKVAPIINSAGRIDDANVALKLFLSDDLKEINKSIKILENLNEKRKSICENILIDAKKMLKNKKIKSAIILYKEDWDIGVLGIVCARLCEEYNRPTILLGKNGNLIKGSARSINEIDIFELLSSCNELLENFGGHKKAGGVSLDEKNLKAFTSKVQNCIEQKYTDKDFEPIKYYDIELENEKITVDLVKKFDILEPFGFENGLPIIKTYLFDTKVARMKNHNEHLMISSENMSILSFNDYVNFDNFMFYEQKEVLLELSINEFNNRKSVKGILRGVNFHNLRPEFTRECEINYLSQLLCENELPVNVKKYTSLKQLENNNFEKVLFVSFNTLDEKLDITQNCSKRLYKVENETNSTLVFALNSVENLNNFNKIVLLQSPLCTDYLSVLGKGSNVKIFVPSKQICPLDIKCDRESLLDIFKTIKDMILRKKTYKNISDFYYEISKKFRLKFSFSSFYLAFLIFNELKLIETLKKENIEIKINKIKTDLENSSIYRKINKFLEGIW